MFTFYRFRLLQLKSPVAGEKSDITKIEDYWKSLSSEAWTKVIQNKLCQKNTYNLFTYHIKK